MNANPIWSHPVTVADIAEEGEELTLTPDEETRAALARFANIVALPSLSAQLHLQPDGTGGALVTGELNATVRQNSVVSLDAFESKLREEIALRFAPEGSPQTAAKEDVEVEESDPSDAIKNGVIDLGAVVSEFFVLGLDPYPRKPGEVFTPLASGEEKGQDNPFAALAKLKKKGRSAD